MGWNGLLNVQGVGMTEITGAWKEQTAHIGDWVGLRGNPCLKGVSTRMYKPVLICLLSPAVFASLPAIAEANQQAIADVAAGQIGVAKASWWGFGPVDSTRALQAAIDSGVPRLTVDKAAGPWIFTPLQLAPNQGTKLEKGVEVLAKADAFRGTNDALFAGRVVQSITLSGYCATLRMRRAGHDDPKRYQKGE